MAQVNISLESEPNIDALNDELRTRFPSAVAAWGAEGILYVDGVEPDDHITIEQIAGAHRPGLPKVPTRALKVKLTRKGKWLVSIIRSIESSPVCRAIWEGGDLSEFNEDEVAAAELLFLRYVLLSTGNEPDWKIESRYGGN